MVVRWSKGKEGKVLCSLFENKLADPRFVKPADIDPVKEMREEFALLSAAQFRSNYKTTATNWITGKGMAGARKVDLDRELIISFVSSSSC